MNKKRNSFKEFVAEAEELIETLHQNISKIEKLADRSRVKPEVINTIFRAAHTLKGMAGMVGLTKLSELSHIMEDLLDKIRMGKVRFEGEVLEILLEGVDLIQEMVANAAQDGPEVDPAPLQEKIKTLLSGEKKEPPKDPLYDLDIDPSDFKVLTEYEGHRLRENILTGGKIYRIVARFRTKTFDTDLSELSGKLNEIGEVISTLPSSDELEPGLIVFNLLVGVSPEDLPLPTVFSQPEVEVHEIGFKGVVRTDTLSHPLPPPKKENASVSTPEVLPIETSTDTADESVKEASIRSQSQTIRVEIARLDTLLNLIGELVLTKAVVHEISRAFLAEHGFSGLAQQLSKASRDLDKRVTEVQEEIIEVRMVPIGQIFDRLVRAVRKFSKEIGKEIDLQLSGEETKMDKSMIEEISDPLMHLVRNALDHGIESKEQRKAVGKPEIGTIWLRAAQKGSSVVIEVEDDGRGINPEKVYEKAVQKGLVSPGTEMIEKDIINLLFLPGFSTRDMVTEMSGRGVGLDVVAKNVTRLSGIVDVESKLGKGGKFSITLPITLVIIKALIIKVGAETFAVPLNSVSESLMLQKQDIRTVERQEVIQLRDHTLSLLRLKELFHLSGSDVNEDRVHVIVVGMAEKRLGFVVDAIEGQREIVIKSLGSVLKGIPGIAGATELGNRQTILVLDVAMLFEEATRKSV